jgi:hypothetical protein
MIGLIIGVDILSKQIEDAVMKSIMELFKGDAVKFFGIDKEIVSVARTEMLQINIQKNINDWFLLAIDDTYLHWEFQTTYNKKDLSRFMVSDAMFYYKEGKPVKTIVIYSSDIEETVTSLDAGSLQYNVGTFYLASLNGDEAYEKLKAKVEAKDLLTKQDLISIVFLPLMKNNVDKFTRLEQAIALSRALPTKQQQLQIQVMLGLLAEKFITDENELKKLKELISMSKLFEMIIEDAKTDEKIEIAKSMLRDDFPISVITKHTGLPVVTIQTLQAKNVNERISVGS